MTILFSPDYSTLTDVTNSESDTLHYVALFSWNLLVIWVTVPEEELKARRVCTRVTRPRA